MIKFNDMHQSNLKYWLTYIVGFVAVLGIIIVSGFYIAKPHLNNFVKREIARRSIKAETSEVSIAGKINLTNVIIQIPNNVSLKIGAISARPPLYFIPGTFTLYNVDLKYNDTHVQIPKISINGVSLKGKNNTVASNLLQSIMRFRFSSIIAPNVLLSIENKNKLTQKVIIKDFHLSGFKNGHIRSIGFKNMDLRISAANNTKQMYVTAKSSTVKACDIDIMYAYSIISGKRGTTNKGETVTGSVFLEDVMVNVSKGTEKISFSLGKFKTSGLKMKPFKQTPEKLIAAYLNAIKENDQTTKKIAQNAIIINTLLAITSADAQLNKVSINAPQLNATLNSFQFEPRQWEQLIPKKILLSLDEVSVFPKKIERKELDFLKNMNLERLDFSGKLDLFYDEKKRILFLNGISFNIKGIGSGEISAEIIDVDQKLFSGQKDEMIATSQNVGITKIDLRYTDAGFIDKLFSYLAQKLNDEKHDLKKELYNNFYLIMTQSPKILLKNHDKAENISKSLGEFSKNPQTLIIKIIAKDSKGLTMADFKTILQNDLSNALNKVNLTVKSNSSP
ncbi:hypothetical protein V3565_01805 [Bartonella sp. B10]